MAVARRAGQLRAQGVKLFDLGAGEPSMPSPQSAVEGAVAALRAGHTRYTAVDGLADLRTSLAAAYSGTGAPWTGEGDVTVTVGAKSALVQAALALVDPGSEVVIPSPCWMTLQAQVRLAGGDPVAVPMSAAGGFELYAAPLLDAITDRTRAVVLNSPCNPTGAVMSQDELRLLVAECADRDVVVVSDETYGAFVYNSSPRTDDRPVAKPAGTSVADLAGEFPDTVLLVSAFSKAYAMTGWRVGYALGPQQLICAMRSLQTHTTSNATSFAMHGALAALKQEAAYRADHVRHCAANRELVGAILGDHPRLRYVPPRGAFYAFPRVHLNACAYGNSTVEIAAKLLDERQVVVVPGEAFGAPSHLRISFAGDSDELRQGLERFAAAL